MVMAGRLPRRGLASVLAAPVTGIRKALDQRYTRMSPAPRETHYYSKKALSGQTLAPWPLAVPGY
jgi:hypothetical protein